MKRHIVGAALLAAAVVPATSAQAAMPAKHDLKKYSAQWHAAHRECGRCAGRNVRRYGVRSHGRVRAASAHEVATSTRQLRRIRNPLLTGQPPAQSPAGVATAKAPAGGTLAAIAACESGGDPTAVDPSGTYRGKYQFDAQTWGSVGGSGDPAAAPESEQDMRAARLYAERGNAPWPICGQGH